VKNVLRTPRLYEQFWSKFQLAADTDTLKEYMMGQLKKDLRQKFYTKESSRSTSALRKEDSSVATEL